MATKSFKMNTPLSNLGAAVNSTPEEQKQPHKKAPGRPLKYTVKRKAVSVQIPESLIEEWREVNNVVGSMSSYVSRLIEADMAAHYTEYQALKERLEKGGGINV